MSVIPANAGIYGFNLIYRIANLDAGARWHDAYCVFPGRGISAISMQHIKLS